MKKKTSLIIWNIFFKYLKLIGTALFDRHACTWKSDCPKRHSKYLKTSLKWIKPKSTTVQYQVDMNIRLAREQQQAALTLLRELMSVEEKEMLKQVEEHLDSIGLTLPEVQSYFHYMLLEHCSGNTWGKNEPRYSKIEEPFFRSLDWLLPVHVPSRLLVR